MPQIRHIGSLTALRFVAAVGILLHHSVGVLLPAGTMAFLPLGHGVTFFFVLSGFILTYAHRDQTTSLDKRSFYRARFARVWPATMVSLLLLMVVFPNVMSLPYVIPGWGGAPTLPVLAAFVLMVQSWVPIPAYFFSFNSVAWSVSVEAFFYLAFPFLLRSLTRSWPWKLLVILAAGIVIILLADASGFSDYSSETWGKVTTIGFSYVNPIVRLKEFVIGMVFGLAFIRIQKMTWKPNTALLTVMELLSIASVPFIVLGTETASFLIFPSASSAMNLFISQILLAGIFVMIIFVFAFNGGLVSRLLSLRFAIILGEISFSIYLLHQIFLRYYETNPAEFTWIPPALLLPSFFVVTCIAAYGSWRWIETPLRRYLGAVRLGRAASRQS